MTTRTALSLIVLSALPTIGLLVYGARTHQTRTILAMLAYLGVAAAFGVWLSRAVT